MNTKTIYAEIITIGDEILYGQILDTNTRWISQHLDAIGIKIKRKTAIGDQKKEIIENLKEALDRSDLVIFTGGLGPTNDDITKNTLANFFNMELVLDESALVDVTDIFKKYGKEVTPINRLQAHLPSGCTKIKNERGTAPGMWFEQSGKIIVSMPGVPFEMEAMMTKTILPKLESHFTLPTILHRIIKTIGIGESWLAEKIETWENQLPDNMSLAYLPGKGQVRLRLTGMGDDKSSLDTAMQHQIDTVLPIIEKYVYGYGDISLAEAVAKSLAAQNLTIATAESCTGGYLSHQLTSIAGSSEYYRGSIVAYHDDIKKNTLQVSDLTLKKHGAVSEDTAREMAENVRKVMGTDIGISITGIAGPSGGTKEKPVGTIWMAISFGKMIETRKIQLPGTRILNIEYTGIHALNFIRQTIKKH